MDTQGLFELEEDNRGKGKVTSLEDAIALSIAPGMTIHMNTGAYASAALREIIRQYWGKDPGFTFVSSGITTPCQISFACSGLVKKIITTNHSYIYPTPKPIPLLQKMQEEGSIEVEEWSLYSLEQRLMAGALGVGFMPTRSLMGSSICEENAHAFKVISDPFESQTDIGVVKALEPDVSLIHGCAADRDGNTILAPPYFTSIWGPRASKGGAIVTVEKIVSSDFIRRHSSLVKVPGFLVRYVCPVPLGAHPQGMASESIGIPGGYGDDYEFMEDFLKASKTKQGLKAWIGEWMLGCQSHQDYLRKLGSERILFLKGKSSPEAWRYHFFEPISEPVKHGDFNSSEMMIVAAAREIGRLIVERGYETILAGIGSPGLAAWLAYYLIKKRGGKLTLLTGFGQIGFAPRPGDPSLMSLSNLMTSTMLTDSVEVYGSFVGGKNNRCLSVLGTAQIDRYGNINTVKVGSSSLIGVGGAADAVCARETLVMAKQSKSRFLNKLPFISCSGRTITTLVTDLGVFEKLGGKEAFTLTKYFERRAGVKKEDVVEEISERCGWHLEVSDDIKPVTAPTGEELALLRSLDPKGDFIGT